MERININERDTMIVIKGDIKTSSVELCDYNRMTNKWDIYFKGNARLYTYNKEHVLVITKPEIIPVAHVHVVINKVPNKVPNKVKELYCFRGNGTCYWHIIYEDGYRCSYYESQVEVIYSGVNSVESENTLEYLKRLAEVNELKRDDTGKTLLSHHYDCISFVDKASVLTNYLNPLLNKPRAREQWNPIFPFGCNNSQYTAVKTAMEQQISVIQGPPGTGKTQTILNIIANILLQEKTVLVVSNNNAATENIYDKLSSPIYNMEFIVAQLGSKEKKKQFIDEQNLTYPSFKDWKLCGDPLEFRSQVIAQTLRLREMFGKQERLAKARQELSHLTLELKYFKQYIQESNAVINTEKFKGKLSSNKWMNMLQEYEIQIESKKSIGLFFKLKLFFKYGVRDWSIFDYNIEEFTLLCKLMFYSTRSMELAEEIASIESDLDKQHNTLQSEVTESAMLLLKDYLARRYESKNKRVYFEMNDLEDNAKQFLKEYPVVMSTTFSSIKSLSPEIMYDYVIMDEASQVDIATGALALACARNVVVVGDTQQLPNVVTDEVREQTDAIFNKYNLPEGYRFRNSFLQSILNVFVDIPQTLLSEHYRCHPKIIDFCNQKFYRGQLIIMTKDDGESDVISAIKTTKGNHVREKYNQRQIDVIKEEVLPKFSQNLDQVGITAPYRNHIRQMSFQIEGVEVDTIHKFQGREKDIMILSTVDDEISDFVDNPNLINVAVSRAKNKLVVVTTGNEQTKERNITDLIEYIQYSNHEVVDSKVFSVFDYLYSHHVEARRRYLKRYNRISEFDSENLMYALLKDILAEDKYAKLDVLCHVPLREVCKEVSELSPEEFLYFQQEQTHVDFLIYKRINKAPLLAIEVDGYKFHKEGTMQSERDKLKNAILTKCQLPLIRCKTNGSNEKRKIIQELEKLIF